MSTFTAGRPPCYINHFAIAVDESYSMRRHVRILPEVIDSYVRFLASLSQDQEQETRISVYTFSDPEKIHCLFYDTDVLRLPSMQGLYHPDGTTALIDCAFTAIEELEQTATLHGEHAFMATVVSDGEENTSRRFPKWEKSQRMAQRIAGLPDNWTTAAFGPDAHAVMELKKCGFPAGNISTWDTTSSRGVERVGEQMREASAMFLRGRSQGVHGYNRGSRAGGLFQFADFSAADVRSSLEPLPDHVYTWLSVGPEHRQPGSDGCPISVFVEDVTRRPYPRGRCYYEHTKTETIQGNKSVAIEMDGRVYSGTLDQVRGFLGLPDYETRVRPDHKPGITIFVQSNSTNRKLLPGTRVLMMR
jgi:hypothetical protein